MSDTSNLLGSVTGAPYSLGLIPAVSARPSTASAAAVKAAAASLPASVDLSVHAMPVGDQGQVGSCAAWATDYGALGYWENEQGIAGGGLEPMYTYSQVTGGNDDGSTIDGNLDVDEQGIDTQSDYWQGNFDYKDQPTAAETANAVNWKLTSFTDLTVEQSASATVTQDSIEQALAAGDPVVIGIPVYANFESVGSAGNGLYSSTSGSFLGYHAIVALGYNSTGLWIENSWNTSWGDNGYATLAWSFVNTDVFQATSVGPLVTGQPVSASASAPSVTGSLTDGQTLTAANGSWNPAATSYAYQWERAALGSSDWSTISGATSATYMTGTADPGNDVRVLVMATNKTGSGASASAAVGPITTGSPINSAVPVATGNLRPGQTLSATTGTWSGTGASYAYQWQRSTNNGSTWSPIARAVSSTYVELTADVNASLRVSVTATNSYGSNTAYSAAVGPVSGAPYSTVAPGVRGTQRQGQKLTASAGTWSPAATSYAYQWQRSVNGASTWASISDQTASTYVLASPDVGQQVRVQVTATNSHGQGIASTQVGPIASGVPVDSTVPAISGTARQGQTLKTTNGTWSSAATSYTYQWQRSTTPSSSSSWTAIGGATGATYVPTGADLGASLRVALTGINSYGQATAISATFGPIASAAPVSTAIPKISGTATSGSTLTASNGGWAPAATSYTYAWQQRSSISGGSWTSISGASGSSYTLAVADQSDQLRVVVTAVNQYGQATADSVATRTVAI
ncbi:MAG: C1 family peptidase [Solirubrobacteraceae bacterium]